jgi:hypothetical protein
MNDAFDGKLILSYQSRILVTDSLVKIVYSYWPTFTGQKMDGSKATSNFLHPHHGLHFQGWGLASLL